MAKSKIYFMDLKTNPGLNLLKKFKRLLTQSGLNTVFSEKELVAIKLHFGEHGNLAYLRPDYTRVIVDILKENKVIPFLTDTNTLYMGRRANAPEHLKLAAEHGYNILSTGAPVVIADGLLGLDFIEVENSHAKLKHFKTIKIASGIFHANGVVVFSHFKGHCNSGFGGAFKNLGMGGAPKPGKLEQHSDLIPFVKAKECTGCNLCFKYCPSKAISFDENKKAVISKDKCIGCGKCIAVCRFGAMQNQWDTSHQVFMERMVEYSYGIWKQKKDKLLFINALIDITPDCDCFSNNDIPLVEDVGILVSRDPVAIEQASFDLVQKSEKIRSSQYYEDIKDKDSIFKARTPDADAGYLMEYAEELGMGSREYELIKP